MTGSTATIYGNWERPTDSDTIVYHMDMDAKDLAEYWRRCSLSSDLLSQYLALFVPETADAGRLRRRDVSSVLSYLLNELFENCAKFSSGPQQDVHVDTWMMPDYLLIQITNHVTPAGQEPFVKIIEELLNNDPHELYFQRLEENVEEDADGSGLGYLTLIKDFDVQFGFKFRSISNDTTAVDIQAKVQLLQD